MKQLENLTIAVHRAYVEKSLGGLVAYFKLPSKVTDSMKAMLDGEGGDLNSELNSFIKLIHKEMQKKSIEPIRIVQDLLIFGVKDGL